MTGPSIDSRFNEIYDATHKIALTLITAKCGRTADISDIFQDTYTELYQVLQKRGASYIANDKAFVLRVAKQKLARYYSLQARLRMFVSSSTVNDDGDCIDISEQQADDFLTEDFAVDQLTLDEAKQYIRSRPEIVQKVFYLFYNVGLTIAEIAKALKISESTVKNKLYRTLKELRNLLI
ncbi:MAG: sigma-70 family RNA polymerase sigma factor [Defluviitaleaceae bacterium]|nr:sigma-70 family RNA polymerase sigma factor [Defluviitaleaceae bacterium]